MSATGSVLYRTDQPAIGTVNGNNNYFDSNGNLITNNDLASAYNTSASKVTTTLPSLAGTKSNFSMLSPSTWGASGTSNSAGADTGMLNTSMGLGMFNTGLSAVTNGLSAANTIANWSDNRKSMKNQLHIQDQQIATNDFNLNRLKGVQDGIQKGTNAIFPKVG